MPAVTIDLAGPMEALLVRAACDREGGSFSWSGRDVDAMRCWRQKGGRPSLADELIFEVDP